MGKFIDLTGSRFGRLLVIERISSENKEIRWRCLCDCGNYTEASTNNLRRFKVVSCGCYRKECSKNTHLKDLEGEIFGKLTVVQKTIVNGRSKCLCKCSCGNSRIVSQDKLVSGIVTSCKECVIRDKDSIDNKRVFPDWFFDILVDDKDREDFLNHTLRTRDDNGSWRKVNCRCKKCGGVYTQYVYKYVNTYKNKTLGYCQNCMYTLSQSPLEVEIGNYIKTITKEDIINNTRSVIKDALGRCLELDIYIPKLKIALEINGSYWHSSLGGVSNKPKDGSFKKFKFCKDSNIHLISIFDVDWWFNQDKVKGILRSFLDAPIILYARNTESRRINNNLGRLFLQENHLDNDSNQSQIYYGLFSKSTQELLSVMSFGKLRGQNSSHGMDGFYELVRFATKHDVKIIGGASKLLKSFEKEYNPQYLLSYSDNDYFTGEVYPKLGFIFQKYTMPDYYWFNNTTKEYLSRWKCQPKKLREKYPNIASKYSSSIENNVMLELKFLKVYRCGQSVWVKDYRNIER